MPFRSITQAMNEYAEAFTDLWLYGGRDVDPADFGITPDEARFIRDRVRKANPAPQPEEAS